MVLEEKMKPGDSSSPAAIGDGAAWPCPSVSSSGSPPSSTTAAGGEKPCTYGGKDDDNVAGAGLPVSRCTTVMNSCGLAWTTLGVCSYTITGFLEPDAGLDDDDEAVGDAVTFSGCGRGPRRPLLLEGDDDASDDGMATVIVIAAAPSSSSLLLPDAVGSLLNGDDVSYGARS